MIESAEKMTVWEKTDEGYGMRRKYAIKERFGHKKDIRGPVLHFLRLLPSRSLFVHSVICYSSESFVFVYDFIVLSCSLIAFLLLLFVSIKASSFQAIGSSIRCE